MYGPYSAVVDVRPRRTTSLHGTADIRIGSASCYDAGPHVLLSVRTGDRSADLEVRLTTDEARVIAARIIELADHIDEMVPMSIEASEFMKCIFPMI